MGKQFVSGMAKHIRKCFFYNMNVCKGQSLTKCGCGAKYCEAHKPDKKQRCERCYEESKKRRCTRCYGESKP